MDCRQHHITLGLIYVCSLYICSKREDGNNLHVTYDDNCDADDIDFGGGGDDDVGCDQ